MKGVSLMRILLFSAARVEGFLFLGYNHHRHSVMGYLSPIEYAEQWNTI